MLNIGASYDLHLDHKKCVLSVVANFTANSFSTDELGGGLEYAFNKQFFYEEVIKISAGRRVG